MGWEQRTLEVVGRVSRHGSDRDRLDDSAWTEFRDRVSAIAREHRYAELGLDVIGSDE